MDWRAYLAVWIGEAPSLAVSALAVLAMVGAAAALGFRKAVRLDAMTLQLMVEDEDAAIEEAAIAADGKSALAQLSGGKLLLARVMGADVSARIAAAETVRLIGSAGRVGAICGDPGYPVLEIEIERPPAWLERLAQAGQSA